MTHEGQPVSPHQGQQEPQQREPADTAMSTQGDVASTMETRETSTSQEPNGREHAADQQPADAQSGAAADVVEPGGAAEQGEPTSAEQAETPPEGGLADLQQRLARAEAEVREHKDQWLRTMAEFKNYKRRAEAERAELVRSAGASLLMKLLPVVDDFERAVSSVPPEIASSAWWSGTQLIAQKFTTLLESEGVKPIEALGKEFDPHLHDAVLYEEAEGQDGLVVAELQKGYRLHERVLRPAMVKVGKG